MISASQQNNLDELLRDAVNRELKAATEKIVEEETKKAIAEVERRLREQVGSIATRICTYSKFERIGVDLVISVKFPSENSHGY